MKHQESQLQRSCVTWFRLQYPQLAGLLTHPANEGNGNRISGAIHKAEGTLPGVSDLLLFLPSVVISKHTGISDEDVENANTGIALKKGFIKFHDSFQMTMGLGIELKTPKGRMSDSQKNFSRLFSSAGYTYAVVRSLDDFKKVIQDYIANVPDIILASITRTAKCLDDERLEAERDKLQSLLSR